MVVQFVGFMAAYHHPGALPPLLAGFLGATLTVWVTFVPCFLFIFAGAPYVERLRHNTAVAHALTAVGAAVVGVILNLGVWFGIATLFTSSVAFSWGPVSVSLPEPGSLNLPAVGIMGLAAVLIFGLRWGTLRVLAVCAAVGAVTAIAGVH